MAKNNKTVDRIQALMNMIGCDDVLDQLIAGTKRIVIENISRLTKLTPFEVTASERDVLKFFQTQKGLLLSDNFKSMILTAVTKGTHQVDEATRGHVDLTEQAHNVEIGAELPAGHVFDTVNSFLVFLAALLQAQWLNKTSGVLIATGHTNIFYVKVGGVVFTIRVYWNARVEVWDCYTYEPDSRQWVAGDRAFSATDA